MRRLGRPIPEMRRALKEIGSAVAAEAGAYRGYEDHPPPAGGRGRSPA